MIEAKRSAGASQAYRRDVHAEVDEQRIARMRRWCERWLGLALIAAAYAVGLAALLAPYGAEWIAAKFELTGLACLLLGIGCGWQARGSLWRR